MNLHNSMNIIKWIAFIFIEGCLQTRAAVPTDISRLRQDLLNGYNQNSVPNENEQNRTTIRISPWLRGFALDEDQSIFTFHMWCLMSWRDYKLKWDPKGYGNLTSILFAPQEIWKPDLYVYNSLDRSDIGHFGNTHLIVHSTGVVTWDQPTRIRVGIKQDLRLWPYDSQSCDAVLYPWTKEAGFFNLAVSSSTNESELYIASQVQNREWRIVSTTIKRRSWTLGEIEYPDIYFTVNIQRRSAIHSCAIIVPGLAIATAILISFWLRPGSVERLAIIMLVIIINALYLNQFYVYLKTHGDRTPLVLLFYRDSLLMVTVALVWTIGLRYLAATKRTSPVPLPGIVESFLASFPAKILCLDPRPTIGSSDTDDEGKLVTSGNLYQADWAWLAHLLDRIAFLIYLILYICFYFALL